MDEMVISGRIYVRRRDVGGEEKELVCEEVLNVVGEMRKKKGRRETAWDWNGTKGKGKVRISLPKVRIGSRLNTRKTPLKETDWYRLQAVCSGYDKL